MSATPSTLISNPPPTSPIFMPDAVPVHNPPTLSWLGTAANMLVCITSGMVFLSVTDTTKCSWYVKNATDILRQSIKSTPEMLANCQWYPVISCSAFVKE